MGVQNRGGRVLFAPSRRCREKIVILTFQGYRIEPIYITWGHIMVGRWVGWLVDATLAY